MYKVKPEHVIPTRTQEQAVALNNEHGGLIGCEDTEGTREQAQELYSVFNYLAKNTESLPKKALINTMVRNFHKLIDIKNTKTVKYSVCAKGCSWCCEVPVEISGFEAAYIELNTSYQTRPSRIKTDVSDPSAVGYCSFHDEKTATCKIHKFRPFVCRQFFTLDDHKNCENGIQHQIAGIHALPSDDPLKKMYSMLLEMTNFDYSDIRDYFDKQ